EALLTLWQRMEFSRGIEVDESAFRHMQQIHYEDRLLIKKAVTSGSRNHVQGYFIVFMGDRTLLNPIALQVMESLTAATALWISKEDAIVQTETRLRNDFIWSLAKKPHKMLEKNNYSRAKLL